MKRLVFLLMCMLLTACETPPPSPPQVQFFHDELFAAPPQPISADNIFALSEGMKHYVDVEIASQLRSKGQQKGLFDALYSKQQLKLEYEADRTRNAAEAFEARSGNCLSLLIMTAALAKHLNMPVTYQSVYNEDTWTLTQGTYFTSSHVNLTLGKRRISSVTSSDKWDTWTIDFLPPDDTNGQHVRSISEDTIIAMYMNNRAAETMAAGQLDTAYWWARKALEHTPDFLSTYNTLGLIYLRHGQPLLAEAVLGHLLQRDPRSTVAMSNMVRVLQTLGRTEAAKDMARKLARVDPEPPFHFFEQGQAAMAAGDFPAARNWFAKEVARAPYQPEFHFWLAVADFRLGEMEEARKHLTIAMQNSTRRSDQQLYAAKLDYLKHLGMQ
ncbi:MAG: tetratricopeptide repeat protein [Rhizobacter sp.]